MTKGPRRLVLDQYLDSAAEGSVKNAGHDWKNKADDLQALGDALKQAAQQAELRIGEQTLTGPALRASMEESSASMVTKAEQLRAAGEALTLVGQQISDTRDARDSLADLGVKPSPYQAPAGTPGVEPTTEEIQAQADASQARQNERSAWQTQYDQQEAKSLALTKEMDAAFLGAIPPMKEIHGQQDPTEPPPNVPSGPGGTYLPGTQAPPPTGGGGDGGKDHGGRLDEGRPVDPDGKDDDGGKDDGKPKPPLTTVITTHPTHVETPITRPPLMHTEGPTSTVSGASQNGVTYQPNGGQVSTPGSVGGSSAGVSAAALGAAGGAGGLAASAVRPGSVTPGAASGSSPVRAIGSTGRAGSPGALSRSAGSAGSSASGRGAGSAGSPASRSAGPAAGRGASTGSSAGRGGAGGRGGPGSGSRSGSRGSSGARSAGAGAGAGGSRGGRKGEREQTTDRDSLVYDQDWLGDDDVAPGVLD